MQYRPLIYMYVLKIIWVTSLHRWPLLQVLSECFFTSMKPRVNEWRLRSTRVSVWFLNHWFDLAVDTYPGYIYYLQAKNVWVFFFQNYAGKTLEVARVYIHFWFNGIIIFFSTFQSFKVFKMSVSVLTHSTVLNHWDGLSVLRFLKKMGK